MQVTLIERIGPKVVEDTVTVLRDDPRSPWLKVRDSHGHDLLVPRYHTHPIPGPPASSDAPSALTAVFRGLAFWR